MLWPLPPAALWTVSWCNHTAASELVWRLPFHAESNICWFVCSHPVLQYAQASCTIPATPQRRVTCAGCHLLKPASRFTLAHSRLISFGLPAAGFLYDIGDYAAATGHVRRLVEDAALRQQMGREARLEVRLFRGRLIFCDVLPNTALLSASWQHDLQAVPCMWRQLQP